MTTRLRVTYFAGGRSKPQRLLIAIGRSVSVSEAHRDSTGSYKNVMQLDILFYIVTEEYMQIWIIFVINHGMK